MQILALNCGGTTFKYKLFQMPEEAVLCEGLLDRVATPAASLTHKRPDFSDHILSLPGIDHRGGIEKVFGVLTDSQLGVLEDLSEISAIAHKLAHGGRRFCGSVIIDEAVIEALEECSSLVPLHNPPSLNGIRICAELLPEVPQVGVFETGFHLTVPPHAYVYGLPYRWLEELSVRKFGFHSTSHRYVLSRAAEMLGKEPESLNLISCHLGSGTSVCAIKEGKSVDISSGLTPQSGTLMSTRHGDFDPAVITYVMRRLNLTPDEMDAILTKESGLLGISGLSGDMRDLEEAAAEGHQRARLAIDAFIYSIRKYLGQYLVLLGRVDALAFIGGIGERSVLVRQRVCENLEGFGICLESELNEKVKGETIISTANSPTKILVIPTDEELMVARDAAALLAL